MGVITQITTAVTGDTITAAVWNDEFAQIINTINGGLENANIKAAAGIAYTKLALTGQIQNSDLAGSIDPAKLSGTAVTLDGTQTLTNKTLTAPAINAPVVNGGRSPITAAAASGTYSFNLDTSNHYLITLNAGTVLSISGGGDGQAFIIHLLQGTGNDLVTWFGGIKWAGGSSPTLTTAAGKIDSFGFIKSGASYYGYIIGLNI
jgi:hypothetical protein